MPVTKDRQVQFFRLADAAEAHRPEQVVQVGVGLAVDVDAERGQAPAPGGMHREIALVAGLGEIAAAFRDVTGGAVDVVTHAGVDIEFRAVGLRVQAAPLPVKISRSLRRVENSVYDFRLDANGL